MDRASAPELAALAQRAFASFGEATGSVLEALAQRVPGTVMVTGLNFTRGEFRVVDARGEGSVVEAGFSLPIDQSLCFHMVGNTGPRWCPDTAAEPAYSDLVFTRSWAVRSYVGAPIELSDGAAVGSVCAISRQEVGFTDQHLELVTIAARMLGYEWEHSARDIELQRLRHHRSDPESADSITGLMKPQSFQVALSNEHECARRGMARSFLALFEIEHGPGEGDSEGPLIKVAAEVLDHQARRTDIVGRIDFKRLAVVLVDCADESGAEDFCRRTCDAFAATEQARGSGASLASSLFNLGDLREPSEALEATSG